MVRFAPANASILAAVAVFSMFAATDPDRDFSGSWLLDGSASNVRALEPVESALTISQSDANLLCAAGARRWSYRLDGTETRAKFGQESWNSLAKWEGAALLVNTLVAGPQNFTVMERWQLSRDRNTLTITRQIVRLGSEAEGTLVYRREGVSRFDGEASAMASAPSSIEPSKDAPPAALRKRSDSGMPPDVTVPSGTRVLLELIHELSTKHAKDGDRVYLRTATPVAVNSRVVIPRGSDVMGTVTKSKKAGRVSGKGELYIRFDSLILPNGVSRDFHARPPEGEGNVDSDRQATDPRTVMTGAGVGATVGGVTHGLPGAGIGGAAGALAGVLLSRKQDVVLRPGTHVEMVLDRDLVFRPEEIP
jgi:hypothetical protein